MEADFELFTMLLSEDDTVQVEVNLQIDNFDGEGERCGICMDIVVDRGVLDCCQHWFCFVCIDSWASIINLCPLCQNEFQLITCVPVHDNVDDCKTDEDLDLRDDDWCVEGKNSTLSYIDENSVTCLDGNSCKIRSESMSYEETLTFDTSIACDSCDTWYHASCVGFNAESVDVDSWLCPRCIVCAAQTKSDFSEAFGTGNLLKSDITDRHCLLNTLSGKLSLSVADAGETGAVGSRIDGELVKEPVEIKKSMSGHESYSSDLKTLDQGIRAPQPDSRILSAKFHESIVTKDEKTKILLGGDVSVHDDSGRSSPKGDTLKDVKADLAPKVGEKRKNINYSFLTNYEDGMMKLSTVVDLLQGKLKLKEVLRGHS